MATFGELLDRLEQLLAEVDGWEESRRGPVLELLDGIDAMHRLALSRLVGSLDASLLDQLRGDDGAVGWLLGAYGLGVDQRAAAEAALEDVRPYIHSHGGEVEVLGADAGVVTLRLSGACAGCTASAETLRGGVEEALRTHMPGFARMVVEEDRARPHPPPSGTLLQIRPLQR